MKKIDIIIIIIVLMTAIIFLFINELFLYDSSNEKKIVEIKVGGSIYKEIDIHSEEEVLIVDKDGKTTNTITISNGYVEMDYATCRDQICVKKKRISRVGENIVCLPNKVSVSIVGKEEGEFDAISQ